jgi:hypothetical protein
MIRLSLQPMAAQIRLVFWILFFVLSANLGIAAGSDSLLTARMDSSGLHAMEYPKDTIWPKSVTDYYDDYSNMLGLFLYAKQKYSSFGVYDISTNKTLLYSPNKQLNMGFGFNYKWLGIGIAFNLGFVNNDDDLYGKTKRLDWQTNIYTNKAVFDFYLQSYIGHYIENPEQVFSGWNNGDAPYIRPDLSTVSLGLSGMHVFNHKKFSYKAAFMQTAVQKKGAGSFLLGASFFVQGIAGDSSIFPKTSDFDSLPPVIAHSAIYFGLRTAYAYNFIIAKHYFISVSLAAELQLGKTANKLEDNSVYASWNPIIHLQPRMGFGYNKPKWYTGFSFVRDSYFEGSSRDESRYEFSFKSGNFRLFAGMRFNWLSRKELMD